MRRVFWKSTADITVNDESCHRTITKKKGMPAFTTERSKLSTEDLRRCYHQHRNKSITFFKWHTLQKINKPNFLWSLPLKLLAFYLPTTHTLTKTGDNNLEKTEGGKAAVTKSTRMLFHPPFRREIWLFSV